MPTLRVPSPMLLPTPIPLLGQLSNLQDPLLSSTQYSQSKLPEGMHQNAALLPGEFHHPQLFSLDPRYICQVISLSLLQDYSGDWTPVL